MNENIHKVVKVESHWLPTCQCDSCIAERARRSKLSSSPSPIRHFSPDVAYLLGYLGARTPSGSFARSLPENSKSAT